MRFEFNPLYFMIGFVIGTCLIFIAYIIDKWINR